MKKHGTVLHLFLTAIVGVGYGIAGEILFPLLTEVVWAPLGIAVYFGLFGLIMLGVMHMLCKARGDKKGWEQKNLSNVVTTAFRRAAVGVLALFLVSGVLELLYELEKREITEASSYVFLIDDSGSMSGTDPQNKRVDAIGEIMAKEEADFPFAVYRFSGDVEKVRDMAPYTAGETFAFATSGGTDIVGALSRVVNDIETGALVAGSSPRVLLLSDGNSSSWGIGTVLSSCRRNHIVVSAISYDFSSSLLKEIAAKTGGIYTEVTDANLLQQEMETAVTSSITRNLLSERFVYSLEGLYIVLRIIFLILIGLLFSWIKQKCYCSAYDHGYADKVFITSVILCTLGAILTEVLFKTTVINASIIRLVFCILWAMTPGSFWKASPLGGTGAVGSGDANLGDFSHNSSKLL